MTVQASISPSGAWCSCPALGPTWLISCGWRKINSSSLMIASTYQKHGQHLCLSSLFVLNPSTFLCTTQKRLKSVKNVKHIFIFWFISVFFPHVCRHQWVAPGWVSSRCVVRAGVDFHWAEREGFTHQLHVSSVQLQRLPWGLLHSDTRRYEIKSVSYKKTQQIIITWSTEGGKESSCIYLCTVMKIVDGWPAGGVSWQLSST